MRVLIAGNQSSVFTEELARYLRREGVDTDLLLVRPFSWSSASRENRLLPPAWLRRLVELDPGHAGYLAQLMAIRRALLRAPACSYDLCHVHYVSPVHRVPWAGYGHVARKRLVSFWGSDVETSGPVRAIQASMVAGCDGITVANRQVGARVARMFPEACHIPIHLARFGLTPLDHIRRVAAAESRAVSRQKLGLPGDKRLIVCGYSASPAHQHIALIEALNRDRHLLPTNLLFVFPMTYGPGRYVAHIRARLRATHLDHVILSQRLSNDDVARLRLAADVMVHVPSHDQLSGTMQEHLFAGSLVIAGSWLPYDVLKERGVFWIEAPSVSSVPAILASALRSARSHGQERSANEPAIWALSNWNDCVAMWKSVYDKTLA